MTTKPPPQGVVVHSLHRLDRELQGTPPAAPDVWNTKPKAQPQDEDTLSNYIVRHLKRDLTLERGVIALREVQIRRGEGEGRGERTDIHVSVPIREAESGSFAIAEVVVEVKGCWNRGLKDSMREQLVERYLKDNECRHGLYVVGWYVCDQWDTKDYRRRDTPSWTLDQARRFFDDQAASLSVDGLRIKSFVLNAALR